MFLPKIVLGRGVERVLLEGADEDVGAEDVDAHRGEVGIGLVGLLGELRHGVVVVLGDDAKARGLGPVHRHDRDGEVRVVGDVALDHLAVVHAVQVVAGQDDDVLGVVALDVADVLIDGVGRAGVPVAARLGGVRRQDGDAAVTGVEVPCLASADVGVQQVRAVLREHAHRVDTRVCAVGEREVDDSVLAPE